MASLEAVVGGCEYPGRGVAIGRDIDGVPFAAYWLTGRSPASQQRELVVSEYEIVVQDVGGGGTDDLRHYTAAIRTEDWVIVGNGTHVSELVSTHADCVDLQVALRNIDYEPDPPIRTPRIFAGCRHRRLRTARRSSRLRPRVLRGPGPAPVAVPPPLRGSHHAASSPRTPALP